MLDLRGCQAPLKPDRPRACRNITDGARHPRNRFGKRKYWIFGVPGTGTDAANYWLSAATSSMARSTGTWTTPSDSLTQP